MIIDIQVVGIYLGMVLFGLIAYAYIIPHFVAKKVKGILKAGIADDMLKTVMEKQVPVILNGLRTWAASPEGKAELNKMLVEMIPDIINTRLIVKDDAGKEHEQPLMNFIASVVIANIKMQLNSLTSAIVRSPIEGEDGMNLVDIAVQAAPKKWKWAAQLFAPLLIQRMAKGKPNSQPDNQAVQAVYTRG